MNDATATGPPLAEEGQWPGPIEGPTSTPDRGPGPARGGVSGLIDWMKAARRSAHPAALRLGRRSGRLGGFACGGPIQLDLHPRAIVRAPVRPCVLGALILGTTPRRLATVVSLGDGATLDLDGATIGRGARVAVGPGAVFSMGPGSYVSCESRVCVGAGVSIGRDCAISWEVTILDDDGHGIGLPPYSSPIRIGDGVWIGCRAIICKGVTIGDGSVVAAGAVVTRSCPPGSLIAGVPARVIRSGISWRDA